jgi:hypothetical protein
MFWVSERQLQIRAFSVLCAQKLLNKFYFTVHGIQTNCFDWLIFFTPLIFQSHRDVIFVGEGFVALELCLALT